MKTIFVKLFSPIVAGQVRHILTVMAGYLVSAGILTTDTSAQLITIISGVIVGAIGFGSSAAAKVKPQANIDVSGWTQDELNAPAEFVNENDDSFFAPDEFHTTDTPVIFKPEEPEYHNEVKAESNYMQLPLMGNIAPHSGFNFSSSSAKRLNGVNPQLVDVLKAALYDANCPYDFGIIQGMRTLSQQRQYLASGASKTLKSKHLKQADGFSHAADIKIVINGVYQKTAPKYSELNEHIQNVAARMRRNGQISIIIGWGGNMWKGFIDAGHWQINRFL